MRKRTTLRRYIIDSLAIPLAKVLVKSYLGEPAATVAGGLLTIAARSVDDEFSQKQIEREFTALAESIIRRILPLFENAKNLDQGSLKAVTLQIAEALKHSATTKHFLANDLDCQTIYRSIAASHPSPQGQFSEAENALYYRGLRETITYLVQVCESLPHFGREHVEQSLLRLTALGKRVDSVLDAVTRLEGLIRSPDKARNYEANYRLSILRTLNYLELFGAQLTDESRRQMLSVAFITLNLHEAVAHRTLDATALLDTLPTEATVLIIRGPAGSGKSTLLRWIALQAAANAPNNALHQDRFRAFLKKMERDGTDDEMTERVIIESALSEIARYPGMTEAGSAVDGCLRNLSPGRLTEKGLETLLKYEPRLGNLNRFRTRNVRSSHEGLAWNRRVPFLILLRNSPTGILPPIEEFPREAIRTLGSPPEGWVRDVLTQGRALVLLDGIDEVPPPCRRALARGITAFAAAYPDVQIVTTTRPESIDSDWLIQLRPRFADINPMTVSDRETFVKRWHLSIASELENLGKKAEDPEAMAEELNRHFAEMPRLGSLAANPLLAAMICALNRDRNRALPSSQYELCEALCDTLLERDALSGLSGARDPSHNDAGVVYWKLSLHQRSAIAEMLAYHMIKNGLSGMELVEAKDIVARVLLSFSSMDKAEAREVLASFLERSGLLRKMSDNELDFLHNTLKEFLAARQFVTNNDYGLLSRHALESNWQNALLFSVASPRPRFAVNVVKRLIEALRREKLEPEKRKWAFLSVRAKNEALYFEDTRLAKECDAIQRSLFPPATMDEARQLSELGDSAIEYLRYDATERPEVLSMCLRSLRLIGTKGAESEIRQYLASSDPTVRSELAQSINPLEISEYRKIFLSGKPLLASVARQVTSLDPLREHASGGIWRLNLDGMSVKDLSPLVNFPELRWLYLSGLPITSLGALEGLTQLECIYAGGTLVEDVRPLSRLTAVRALDLESTRVSDIEPLKSLSGLEWLDLSDTQVANLKSLRFLHRLMHINIRGLPIPPKTVQEMEGRHMTVNH